MKTPITYLTLAALLASASQAQQTPSTSQPTTTQAQPATASPAPCSKPAPSQPHKQGWLEKKARAFACKQNKNLCDLPSSASDTLGTTPDAKPCPATTAVPAPPAKPLPQAPPAPASGAPGSRPTYVCPPKTALIPNTAYCLAADHTTTLDAIPLPPSLAAPTPSAKTPAQAKPQQ